MAQGDVYFFRGLVVAVDRQQFGFNLLTEDPCCGVAAGTRHRTTAKRPINMDGPTGDNLRA